MGLYKLCEHKGRHHGGDRHAARVVADRRHTHNAVAGAGTPISGYSPRRAVIGLTRVARRAGR